MSDPQRDGTDLIAWVLDHAWAQVSESIQGLNDQHRETMLAAISQAVAEGEQEFEKLRQLALASLRPFFTGKRL